MATNFLEEDQGITERVVNVSRVAKVVKGGRRFSFSAIVVVGDMNGCVGIGLGKANEVPEAIRKASDKAKKAMIEIPITNDTIPHEILGRYGAGNVLLKPASKGTGVIAGGPVRAVIEISGIKNILTKSIGSNNPHNMVKATINGLKRLRSAEEIAKVRGVELERIISK